MTAWHLPAWPATDTATRVHTLHLLGAESSGKTQLSLALAERLRRHGLPCLLVNEQLRHWVNHHQRTPQAHEQAGIAIAQASAIVDAREQLAGQPTPGGLAVVIADTSPLMTAVYSQHYFGDSGGLSTALAFERGADQRWLMGLDLPWQADPGQRDGPAHRDAVDAALRQSLDHAALSYQVIYGMGAQREQAAWLALQTALQARSPQPPRAQRWRAACDCCADPDCELALFTRLTDPTRNGV